MFPTAALVFIRVSDKNGCRCLILYVCIPDTYIATNVVCSYLAVLDVYMNDNALASDPSMHDCI